MRPTRKQHSSATRLAFAVLADTHKQSDSGKVDCFGLFDTVRVWATPATRECSLAIGLADVLPGLTQLAVWLRKGKQRPQKMASMSLESTDSTHSAILAQRLHLVLKTPGRHEVGVQIGTKPILWIPLAVVLEEWPTALDGERLRQALADPNTLKAARAILTCRSCESSFVFEVHLNPEAPLSKGALAFPPKGVFRCPKCETVHHLRDIEGQLRSQLGKVAGPAQ